MRVRKESTTQVQMIEKPHPSRMFLLINFLRRKFVIKITYGWRLLPWLSPGPAAADNFILFFFCSRHFSFGMASYFRSIFMCAIFCIFYMREAPREADVCIRENRKMSSSIDAFRHKYGLVATCATPDKIIPTKVERRTNLFELKLFFNFCLSEKTRGFIVVNYANFKIFKFLNY